MYQEIKDRINGSGISVGHVNIRGLVKNLNELRILLNHAKFDVIGIIETHLTEDVDSKEVHVEGYVLYRMDRQKNKQGGGCAVYVKENLDITVMTDYEAKEIEAIWIELHLCSQRLMIGTVYKMIDHLMTRSFTAISRQA